MQSSLPQRVATASTVLSAALWLWNAAIWFLDQVEHVQTAHDLYEGTGVFSVPGLIIHWGTVYFILLVFSATFLVALYSGSIRTAWRKYKESRQYHWDASLNEGAHYVAFASAFGEATKSDDTKTQLENGLIAIWEGVRNGKLPIAGSPQGSVLPKLIARSEAKKFLLEYKLPTIVPYAYRDMDITNLRVVNKNGGDTVFDRLVVDSDRIKRMWPPAKLDYRI